MNISADVMEKIFDFKAAKTILEKKRWEFNPDLKLGSADKQAVFNKGNFIICLIGFRINKDSKLEELRVISKESSKGLLEDVITTEGELLTFLRKIDN